jgi:hypothetical protein
MRLLLFLAIASALTAYAFWVYLRVELSVPVSRWLAVVRAAALVLVLLLLFDPPVPGSRRDAPTRWVLLDASVSMSAADEAGRSAWDRATERARELEEDGWSLVRFGGDRLDRDAGTEAEPNMGESRLLPALEAAAESGAREVRVLSDLRFEDAVALRGAAERLPLDVAFEAIGDGPRNLGVARLDIPDVRTPDEAPVATIEVFGGRPGDSIEVALFEEEREVSAIRVQAPSPGLRTSVEVTLPPASVTGRVRYAARIRTADAAEGGDGFPLDDEYVSYVNVGYEEGGLTLVSFRPDWEPRYLLPVLEDVTGLRGTAYLRAGADRYVRSGRAAERGAPVDSATVRRAAASSSLLVVHGFGAESDAWAVALVAAGGRRLVLPSGPEGARAVGVEVGPLQGGEWYASPDVPTSPIAGALTGIQLQGLPPLTGVMSATTPNRQPVLQLQLRGAGAPANGFHLVDDERGRLVVALSSSYWRWAARDDGRAAYRSLWSGLAGWLLAGERSSRAEPRPSAWVLRGDEPIGWSLPGDSVSYAVTLSADGVEVLDTMLASGARAETPPLPIGTYDYVVRGAEGDTLGAGRFDVTTATSDMLPAVAEPEQMALGRRAAVTLQAGGRPLRTSPLPYLLLIALLCGEWVVRRRSGLR